MQHLSQLISLPARMAPAASHSTQPGRASSPSAATSCHACKGYARVYVKDEFDARLTHSIPCPRCGAAVMAADLQSVYPVPAAWADSCLDQITAVVGEDDDQSAVRALEHARRYAAAPRGWLVLQGPPGNGKTMLLAGIRSAALARKQSVVFLPARSIADLIYRAIQPDTMFSLQKLEEEFRTIELLIVDELCKVDWSKPYVHDQFYAWLNWRYEHEAPTCLAFNDDARIPDAMYSRMRDGRWGDGLQDGIRRITVADQRPYLDSLWEQPR